jgi:hypothetical protein
MKLKEDPNIHDAAMSIMAKIRQENAKGGSPCKTCKRSKCPDICWPRKDYEKRRKWLDKKEKMGHD